MILIKWTWFMNLIGFRGFTIGFILIYKYTTDPDDAVFIRHETIHLKQQIELLFVFQWILYGFFYLQNRFKGMKHKEAYRQNPFEKEAYDNEKKESYLSHRKHYAWINYL